MTESTTTNGFGELIPMAHAQIESPIPPAIQQFIDSSAQRDVFIAVILGVMGTVWVIKQVAPLIQWMKGENKDRQQKEDEEELLANSREAIRIVLQRDLDGQYVILGIPKMLRDFTTILAQFTDKIGTLVNHQSETLKHLNDKAEETQRLALKIKSATDFLQKEQAKKH